MSKCFARFFIRCRSGLLIQFECLFFSLANLHPPTEYEELDSYMYQSVGAEGIKALAASMQLPLYRKEITGTPKNIAAEYNYEPGDEVEDLFYLLNSIKLQNPDIEGKLNLEILYGALGVSVGAIFSTYQKGRQHATNFTLT